MANKCKNGGGARHSTPTGATGGLGQSYVRFSIREINVPDDSALFVLYNSKCARAGWLVWCWCWCWCWCWVLPPGSVGLCVRAGCWVLGAGCWVLGVLGAGCWVLRKSCVWKGKRASWEKEAGGSIYGHAGVVWPAPDRA